MLGIICTTLDYFDPHRCRSRDTRTSFKFSSTTVAVLVRQSLFVVSANTSDVDLGEAPRLQKQRGHSLGLTGVLDDSHHCQIADKNTSKRWNGEFQGFRTCIGWISTTGFCAVGFYVLD